MKGAHSVGSVVTLFGSLVKDHSKSLSMQMPSAQVQHCLSFSQT